MTTRATFRLPLFLSVLLLPSPSAADTVQIPSDADATIFSEDVNGANGAGHLFSGRTNNGHERRALLHFDLSGIPAGSMIDSVSLRLECTRTQGGTTDFALHRMTKAWTEGPATGQGTGGGQPTVADSLDVTWRYASFTPAMTDTFVTPGGDFDGSVSAAFSVGVTGTYQTTAAQLTTDVAGWVATPSDNHGWILVTTSGGSRTTRRFDGREGSNDPLLIVTFTPPTPVEAETWGGIKGRYRGD